jgi:hypothetical protein
MKRIILSTALLALSAVSHLAPKAWSADYTYTKIADTTTVSPLGTFNNFGASVDSMRLFTGTPPAISGSTVAFFGAYGGNHGIFVGDGGSLLTIAKTGDSAPSGTFNRLSDITISDDTVAFHGRFAALGQSTQFGVFSGDGGSPTTIAKTGDAASSGVFLSAVKPSISGATVLFGGSDNAGGGIFASSGGATTTILREGDAAPSGTFIAFFDAVISDDTVAFVADDSSDLGIFTISGGAVTTIVKDGDPAPSGFFSALFNPAISGADVAFRGRFASQTGIFVGNGGQLTTIAKTGDAAPSGTFTDFSDPAVSGITAAFRGLYSGGDGIFVGDGGPITTVIKTGDSLFGSTVLGVGMGRFGLDPFGSGNLAFAYALTDGRLGIAVASPVPEPNTLVLSCISAFAVVLVTWKQRCNLKAAIRPNARLAS